MDAAWRIPPNATCRELIAAHRTVTSAVYAWAKDFSASFIAIDMDLVTLNPKTRDSRFLGLVHKLFFDAVL